MARKESRRMRKKFTKLANYTNSKNQVYNHMQRGGVRL